ncbi:tetratricopeptide repeat protein [uncultured Desulfovibrio sp.]|uniref:tetratricopeptide repeat protein n=1 Tax=uncultured Desulfovibrio sp. TaxID=167968 RepID=UPI002637B47E|nr:tetratricopeptide repeat protein [uncultured Desulfovibrio sp.]
MTEKIEWYKEVLELEPGSKVFFPLARLLVEDGRRDEAVDVLERGLERHEEFLEARLYLIELLHASGRAEACERQVSRLSRMFTAYAGFWRAWAACLENAGAGGDTAAVLQFLALNFSRGKVSLHDVFARGLAAYSAAGEAATLSAPGDAPVQPAENAGADEAAEAAAPVPVASPEAAPAAEPAAEAEPCAEFTETSFDPDAAMADDQPLPETFAAMEGGSMPAAMSAVEEPPVSASAEAGGDRTEASVGVVDVSAASGMLSGEEVSPAEADMADGPAQGADGGQPGGIAAPAASILAVDAPDEADEGEERFSLRTRSMAEVLAEQGDIRGALDIYHELAAAAVDPEESADLRQRIATLSARLSSAQPAVDAAPEPARGKDRLISMLEALAERVEARAQN